MTNRKLSIPEPVSPEHAIIRDSAPVPELSAGFRSRVMSDCNLSIAAARRAFRRKVAGTCAAVCSLGLLFCMAIPEEEKPSTPEVVEKKPDAPAIFHHSTNSESSLGLPSSSGLTVDMPKPGTGSNAENRQMNQMIEDLSGRQQIFDASMLPEL